MALLLVYIGCLRSTKKICFYCIQSRLDFFIRGLTTRVIDRKWSEREFYYFSLLFFLVPWLQTDLFINTRQHDIKVLALIRQWLWNVEFNLNAMHLLCYAMIVRCYSSIFAMWHPKDEFCIFGPNNNKSLMGPRFNFSQKVICLLQYKATDSIWLKFLTWW